MSKAKQTHRRFLAFKHDGYGAEVEIEIKAATDARADWAMKESLRLMRGYGWTQTFKNAIPA